ncbi:MAG: hypothetical protein M3176_01840, partial [Chloroflexota bacterium]|nr:hypothetical protein [Chloroflexota bacterium]
VHVSRELVVPLSVEPVGDLLAALTDAGVELRITPSLSIAMERGPGGEVSQELLADASHGLYGSPALGPVRKVSPPSVSGTSSSSR